MKRLLVLAYGLFCYVVALGTFTYLAAFLAGLTPLSVAAPVQGSRWQALIVNMMLIGAFGLQHSVMARPTFKAWWARFVPEPIERSTYVMFTNLVLILMFWQWRPVSGVVWDVQQPIARTVIYNLFAFGWSAVLVTTFLLSHFDLFGVRQVWLYFRGRPYAPLRFRTPGPYKLVRHPLYVGWLFAFWAIPTMTPAHFLLAMGITVYILLAIQLEERNLTEYHGETYTNYRRSVPMLIPGLSQGSSLDVAPDATPNAVPDVARSMSAETSVSSSR